MDNTTNNGGGKAQDEEFTCDLCNRVTNEMLVMSFQGNSKKNICMDCLNTLIFWSDNLPVTTSWGTPEDDPEFYDEMGPDYCYENEKQHTPNIHPLNAGKDSVEEMRKNLKLKTPKEIKAYLDDYVIGQDEAKKTVSIAIYNHYKRLINDRTDIQKSNILMLGPTGVGKTEIARTVAKMLDVPFAICDATTLTEAGYVGDDAENILLRLIQNADWEIERAEWGIIYLDEIDKIAREGENRSITRDVSGEGVQQALLKIIEGAEIEVPITGGRKHPLGERVLINTENILFICGGAFEGLTMKKEKSAPLGFGAVKERDSFEDLAKNNKITAKDIEKQGIIPELAGRLPIIATLNPLKKDDLAKILTEPKNSIYHQYSEFLSMDNASFLIDDKAVDRITEDAINNNTGARGLKGIIENAIKDAMFDIPSISGKKQVVLTVSDKNELSTIIKSTSDKTKKNKIA